MSTKVAAKAKSAPAKSAKAAPAKTGKAAKEAAPAKAAKGAKASAAQDEDEVAVPVEGGIDPDEAEEAEDAAAGSSGGGGGSAAALAAASGSSEMSASFKNFRHHPDMENFYRFIYDNDLRLEALKIIDILMTEKIARRAAGKPAGKSAH